MKKKILFIIPNLMSGGAEMSLVNLLSMFDYNKYEVSLFLLKKEGLFLNRLSKNVNLLETNTTYQKFTLPLIRSILYFFFHFQWKMIYHRIMFTLINRKYPTNKAEQYSWKHLEKAIGHYSDPYDVVVGYLEKTSIYSCIDSFKAPKKIGFIRINYTKLNLDKSFDNQYFEKLDYLCANGEASFKVLKQTFPQHKEKIKKIINVVSPKLIREMSMEFQPYDKNKINIISVGRLTKVKGYELLIAACKILIDKGYDICWHVIGKGDNKKNLENLIEELNLKESFQLIGEKTNPYPYIANANIFVHASYFEGRSNTINEAKILNKPIVATNFDFVYEQIENGSNGLIVSKNPEDISEAIISYIKDDKLRKKVSENLAKENLSTEKEIQKLYQLIDN